MLHIGGAHYKKMVSEEDEDVDVAVTSKPVRKRNSFSLDFKQKVFAWLDEDEQRTAYQASQHFKGVSQSTIRGWIISRDAIESFNMPKRCKRIPGAGRRPLLEEYEHFIADAVRMEREEKKRVRRSDVLNWAKQIAAEHGVEDFKASAKWLDGFMKRNSLSLRRRTNLTTVTDGDQIKRNE
jgi:hypothetical protein